MLCLAKRGASARSMAWISSLVSVPARLKNTADMRCSWSPARSSASMVLAKVGTSGLRAMAAISRRLIANALSKAGTKWAISIRSKGGMANGVVHSASSGLPTPTCPVFLRAFAPRLLLPPVIAASSTVAAAMTGRGSVVEGDCRPGRQTGSDPSPERWSKTADVGARGLTPRRSRVDHLAGHAAVEDELGAGDEAGLGGEEVGDGGGHVLGPADAAGGVLGMVARREGPVLAGVDPTRGHAVDPYLGRQRDGESVRERDEPALARRIGQRVGLGHVCPRRGDGDDGPVRLLQVRGGGPGQQAGGGEVDGEHPVPAVERHGRERARCTR